MSTSHTNVIIPTYYFIDTIHLDHPYACQPVCQRPPPVPEEATTVAISADNTSFEPSIESSVEITVPASDPVENVSIRETETTFSYNTASSSSYSPPSTPKRRSQRQLDRQEKTLLEKIKAENAEMLKREKEEMEAASAKLLNPIVESVKPVEPDLPEGVTIKKENIEDDEKVDDGLIIDFGQQEKKKAPRKRATAPGSVTAPKRKKKSLEANVIIKSESDQTEIQDRSETTKENVEAKEGTKGAGQRTQRQRRKPKRWDDDEVEVDFSGTASELAYESSATPAKKVCPNDEPESKEKSITSDEENEDEDDADKDDDDDPTKLWCICRQPHNNRFMILCEGCEDWFHGKCVGMTKAKNTKLEAQGIMWYCDSCKEKNGSKLTKPTTTPKAVVKQEPVLSKSIASPETPTATTANTIITATPTAISPAQTTTPVVTPAGPVAASTVNETVTKVASNSVSSNNQVTPKKPIKAKSSEGKEILAKKIVKKENLMKIGDVLKQRKLKAAGGNLSAVDKKEGIRLKKLIKSSKLELKKKINKVDKSKAKATTPPDKEKDKEKEKEKDKEKEKEKDKNKEDNKWEPISKVVPLIRNKEEKKKKLKIAPVDRSLQDLFKAEPSMVLKKLGQSTPTTPTTPNALTPKLKRPSIGSESSLKKSMPTSEQNCVSCGKQVAKGAIKGKEFSIYCTETCLEKHVKDTLDIIKQARAHSSNVNGNKGEKHRVNLVDRATNRLISGQGAPTDDKVLEYIRLNPTFEIMKPNLVRRQSSQSSDHEKKKDGTVKNNSTPPTKVLANKRKEDPSSVKAKPSEVAVKSQDSRRDDNSETIRHNVKKVLKETLQTRCLEAENKMLGEDIKKIAFKIEEELFNHFNKEAGSKYKTRYRSLVFNLKDPKNQGLFRKVLTGSITPERLVRMSPDELASSELAKWRERENKHALEMIKRDAEAMASQVIVKKTHKGEEVIETKISIETIDPTKEEEIAKSEEAAALAASSTSETSVKEKITSNALSALDLLRDDKHQEDTTDKHGQHLFDAHCKICTKKTKSDLSLTHTKSRKAVSPSPRTSNESKTPQPKRVRVEFEAPTTRIIEEAVKASKSTKHLPSLINESSIYESSEDLLPSSTVSSSPEAKSNQVPICWKGFIFMQEVAKFVATAYRISGIADNRLKDVPDTITVRGRIAPEQVLDYLKKLKSTRTDIAVIQFAPAIHEENSQYEKFFAYLNRRKRYGVIGSSKSIKDFYILPLPKDADPPEVLLPFDGPGIPINRPNLLLGILVKYRKHPPKAIIREKVPAERELKESDKLPADVTNNSVKKDHPENARSYTPPPPGAFTKIEEVTNEEPYDPGRSLTPPPPPSSSLGGDENPIIKEEPKEPEKKVDEDEPYDPEENDILNIPSTSTSSIRMESHQKISQLLEQISKTANPLEMKETLLDSITKEASDDDQKLLTEAFNKKVEDFKKQLEEEERKATEAAFTIASKTIENENKNIDSIPGLDGSYPTTE